MNFRLVFLGLILLILCSSIHTIAVDPKSSKCFPQCMAYCANENESGIPASLCNNVCTASCYTGGGRRRDVGNANSNMEN